MGQHQSDSNANTHLDTHLELDVVHKFDLQRYMGTWNVVSNIPNRIEHDHVRGEETYTLLDDGTISTKFIMTKKDGTTKTYTSHAHIPDDAYRGHWLVRFNVFAFISLPYNFDYCIIDLDRVDYEWVIVGTPDRGQLWIMSRTGYIDPISYSMRKKTSRHHGFDTRLLYKLPQRVEKSI
jgi:lipocalin